jgi:WD40 repeat protein
VFPHPKPKSPPPIDPTQAHQSQELKHGSPLVSCRFDPDGRFVFAGAQDSTVQRWELATGKKAALAGHNSWVRALAFAPAEKLLVSGDYHGRILCWPWDAAAPSPVRAWDAHDGWVRAVAVCPYGRLIASCGNDHLVKIWSVADGNLVRPLAGHDCHVYNVAFHPDGRHLLSADLKGNLRQWDLVTGAVVRSFDAAVLWKYDGSFRADIGGARGLTFRPDGGQFACSGITEVTNAFAGVGKPAVLLFDWASGKRVQALRPKEPFEGTAWNAGYHPNGFLAGVGGGQSGALWFWKPEESASFFSLKLPHTGRDLHLHPDGRRLAVPLFDGSVRVYTLSRKPPA